MTAADTAHSPSEPVDPQFSVISAVYNVERYLDDYIDSIEAQTHSLDDVEVIVVDDGSTDASLEKLRAWEQRRPDVVRVLTKENGGQGSARNLGLQHARGTWVTFTDPDDRLEPAFFERVDRFLQEEPKVHLVATRLVMLDDETGEVTTSHPLRAMFRDGDVARRLNESTDFFAGSAPSAFFRREQLVERGVLFDDRVQPNFEDGHFTSSYLLGEDDPVVGFVATARYVYRRRSDGTSTLQRSVADPRRYTNVLRHGYLDVLTQATERFGAVPGWLQSFVLYDLSWYFSSYERLRPALGEDGVVDEFHRLLAEITRHLDDDIVTEFQVRSLKREWRAILQHGYQAEAWHEPGAVVTGYDDRRKLVRLSYLFTGPPPDEVLRVRGRVVQPYSAKNRAVLFVDRELIHERILWVSARASVRLRIDGRDVAIQLPHPGPKRTLFPGVLRREFEPDTVSDEDVEPTPAERRLQAMARSRPVRRLFRDAWVLIDRIHDADDSAEHLFRYLRSDHRDVNAWFVVEKDTPDWRRLKKEGFRRLVPFGSLRWKLLMLNARHLVSSHADESIIRPPDLEFADAPWRFTFLQHGVIKDDLSGWLNTKPIECFVTSTQAEFDSIAGDGTSYVFTSKETVLTGLPRFDLLRQAGDRFGPADRDLVLVSPTWRNWLLPPLLRGSQRRPEFGPEFFESEFLSRWLDVLRSEEVAAACERHGRRLALLPHPNLADAVDQLDLPGHVELLTFTDADVRELFARAALLVTDYSSTAFNSAFIDRPVVYYQFDRDRVLGGDHVGRAGYFDYERDGFGPVVTAHEELVAAVVAALEHGPTPTPVYRDRIAATFGPRDGRCRERVTKAIRALDAPLSVKQAVGRPR